MKTKTIELILITAFLAGAVIVTSLAGAQTTTVPSRIDPIRRSYLLFEVDRLGDFPLQRVYSSRSIFRGHFGIGWCSSLDASLTVAGAKVQYRGCDLKTGDRIDSRNASVKVERTKIGFRRILDNGQVQVFDPKGRLVQLTGSHQTLMLSRNSIGQITSLTTKNRRRHQVWNVTLEGGSLFSLEESMIRSLGPDRHYTYSDGNLTSVRVLSKGREQTTRMAYDEMLNLSHVISDRGEESMAYNTETDELIHVTRTTAFGRDRMVLGGRTTPEVEIRIEMKRGVEIHPVRILYDRETQSLSFEGSRLWARQIYDWFSV